MSSFEFRILGPVGLARGGVVIRLGSAKRMSMLTALLLDANRPVSLSRLTAAMWSGPPPRSAVANVRTHASALRRALGERLVARPWAYLLRVDDGELDAVEFSRLAKTGRQAVADGEPATAIERLGAALALWRGSAGEGVARGTSLETRLVALDEQRLDVVEEHIEARLHTRSFSEIAADLRRHLAVWPVRERCWALLMLTLYRSGNVGGALAAYGEARAALREHLGVEPGPRLQRLQRAALKRAAWLEGTPPATPAVATPTAASSTAASSTAASSTAASSTAASSTGEAVDGAAHPAIPGPRRPSEQPAPPRQLPPRVEQLTGRDTELATLTAILRQYSDVVVSGRAGVGKTALAVSSGHVVADAFPDGQVTLDLTGSDLTPRPPDDLVATILRTLGVPADQLPPTADERAACYRSIVSSQRVLILLDDAASDVQLLPLLADGAATLLVTSRHRPTELYSARHVELGPLADEDAISLLTGYAGTSRVASDPAGVRDLVRLCDGLPLALRIVGEQLARRPQLPPTLLAAHLANRPLDGLQIGNLSVRDRLAADYRAITAQDPVAAHAFPLLSMLAPNATTTPEVLAGRLGEDASRVFYALEHLVDAWLAETPQPGHYRTVGLTRAYAAELSAEDTGARQLMF